MCGEKVAGARTGNLMNVNLMSNNFKMQKYLICRSFKNVSLIGDEMHIKANSK